MEVCRILCGDILGLEARQERHYVRGEHYNFASNVMVLHLARPPYSDRFTFSLYMSSNAAAGAFSRKSIASYEPLEPRTCYGIGQFKGLKKSTVARDVGFTNHKPSTPNTAMVHSCSFN